MHVMSYFSSILFCVSRKFSHVVQHVSSAFFCITRDCSLDNISPVCFSLNCTFQYWLIFRKFKSESEKSEEVNEIVRFRHSNQTSPLSILVQLKVDIITRQWNLSQNIDLTWFSVVKGCTRIERLYKFNHPLPSSLAVRLSEQINSTLNCHLFLKRQGLIHRGLSNGLKRCMANQWS